MSEKHTYSVKLYCFLKNLEPGELVDEQIIGRFMRPEVRGYTRAQALLGFRLLHRSARCCSSAGAWTRAVENGEIPPVALRPSELDFLKNGSIWAENICRAALDIAIRAMGAL